MFFFKQWKLIKIITTAVSIALLASSALALTSTSVLANHHKKGHHVNLTKLDKVIAAQSDKNKLRNKYRHPKQTLEYFGIAPGMTVAEVLPGGHGWYSKILLPYLGAKGKLIGVDYNMDMWKVWRGDGKDSAKFLEGRKTWAEDWLEDVKEWKTKGSASVGAFAFGAMPEKIQGSIDAFLWIRAIHHINRFEDKGSFRMPALKEMYASLKPGGIVGIVQHRSPEKNSDEWALGDNGYVKQSVIIQLMKAAGFKLVSASEINANVLDIPSEDDLVWRLAPALSTSRDDPAKRKLMEAIGESDRMTLKFRKPK